MARILHVSYFPVRANGCFTHAVATKLSNGLIRNGHMVVNWSDRDVARASTLFGSRRFGRKGVNQALLELAQALRPDLLMFGHADMIDPETVAAIREKLPALRVLQWNVDPMFEPDNVNRLLKKVPVVDATFVSTAGEALRPLQRPGMVLGFLPNPADPSVETGQNHLKRDLPYDLFYACGNPARPLRRVAGRDWNMDEFVTALAERLPEVKLLLGGVHGKPHITGGDYQPALESVAIGLNLSRRADSFLYSSDRLSHVAGNGQLVMIERSVGYDTLFGDDQMSFFSTFDELVENVRKMVAEPELRMKVAAAGRARYFELFNERIVARYMFDAVFGTLKTDDYSWPTLLA